MKCILQAVLFDLDGVVVFSDKYHYLAWKRVADEEGLAFDEIVNHRLRGIPRMASLEAMLDHNRIELPMARKLELCERKNAYYVESLKQIDASAIYPGVVAFLDALRNRGVAIGLCSSSKNAQLILDKLDLVPYFDAVVTGHDFKHPKPHPEIFLTGAAALHVSPSACLVFEDAESGVASALAAGMPCIGIGTPDVLPNAPVCITDYGRVDIESTLETGRPTLRP